MKIKLLIVYSVVFCVTFFSQAVLSDEIGYGAIEDWIKVRFSPDHVELDPIIRDGDPVWSKEFYVN